MSRTFHCAHGVYQEQRLGAFFGKLFDPFLQLSDPLRILFSKIDVLGRVLRYVIKLDR